MELVIQPLRTEQLAAAVELDQICLGGLWTLEGYQRELASPNSDLITLLIGLPQQREFIAGIGCFWAILEEAHITLLAVHPDYQGQGLGQLILCHLLRSARQRKLERATLEVRESNQVALAIYQKFGFQLAGRRKGYYRQNQEDALIFWLSGLQDTDFLHRLNWREQQLKQRLCQHNWQLHHVSSSS